MANTDVNTAVNTPMNTNVRQLSVSAVSFISRVPPELNISWWKVSSSGRAMIYDDQARTLWVIDQKGNTGKLTFEHDYEIELEYIDEEYEYSLDDIPEVERYRQIEQRGNAISGVAEVSNETIDSTTNVEEMDILITAVSNGQVYFITLYWHGYLVIDKCLSTDNENVRIHMTPWGFYQTLWIDNSTVVIRPDGESLTINEPLMILTSGYHLAGEQIYTMDGELVYSHYGSMSIWDNYVLHRLDEDDELGPVVIVNIEVGEVVEEYELGEEFINLIVYNPVHHFAVVQTESGFVVLSHGGVWTLDHWQEAYATEDGLITYVDDSRDTIMVANISIA